MRTALRTALLFALTVTACAPTRPVTPTDAPSVTPSPAFTPTASPVDKTIAGYMTFAVNVHDTAHVGDSADTLLRLIGIFEKYGVRGDFYLTGPMVTLYADQRPDVIARLRESSMTISYHVRPPHPLYNGFDQRLQGLDDAGLAATLRDYETFALDLATGDLLRDRPGGYTYLAQLFGRSPAVASAPNSDRRIKSAGQRLYAELGAQMTVTYHEAGTDPNDPFEYVNGLLVRPSDFSITRVTPENGGENFWWNLMSSPRAAEFRPTTLLEQRLGEWNGPRLPFITALIHENNLYRSGAEAWTLIYYSDTDKVQPLSPPFDLNAPDASRPRPAEEQAAIWAAYEELVAYAATHLRVVTSEDTVALAAETR